MKRFFAILITAILCLSLASCSQPDDPQPAQSAAPQPTPTAAPQSAAPTDETETLLSEPYAKMLTGGDYQYTYPLTYEDKAYTATIAAKDGMYCRKVTSDDGTYSVRVVTIDGAAWQVDDLTGATTALSAETAVAEVQPDYGASLVFAGANTLETGYIAEAYDFEYQGAKCNIVFVLSPEGELVMLVPTVSENTSQMEILEMKAPAEEALFKAPEIEETALKQNEVFGVGGMFYVTVGEAYTYDDDLFLNEAGSGYQWLGVSVFLKNVSGETLAPFTEFITDAKLIHGADTYEALFSEANPKGSDYAETPNDIEPDTEIEAFMKFKIPAGLAVSDGFTLCFTIGDTFYSCKIQ